ncbi:acetyltransferase [Christensenellaceae bacterium OttesenSCG-928-K19]|nr:acetyltransferase [Christensenellaceae bacterium OttesenSCG-928-K19]
MKEKLVMVGAGPHAVSVMDIAIDECGYDVVGCIDRDMSKIVLGIPVIGNDEMLPEIFRSGVRCFFVAMGNNQLREKLFKYCMEIGMEPANIISTSAQISRWAKLGKGICVLRNSVVHTQAEVGDNCIINTGATVDHDCNIGETCHISVGAHICGSVRIGAGTLVGPGSVIRDGVSVGENTVIGMGASVVCDIPAGVMAYGVPAKVVDKKRSFK